MNDYWLVLILWWYCITADILLTYLLVKKEGTEIEGNPIPKWFWKKYGLARGTIIEYFLIMFFAPTFLFIMKEYPEFSMPTMGALVSVIYFIILLAALLAAISSKKKEEYHNLLKEQDIQYYPLTNSNGTRY